MTACPNCESDDLQEDGYGQIACVDCGESFPECEYCAGPWHLDHDCHGTRGEAHHARMMEEGH